MRQKSRKKRTTSQRMRNRNRRKRRRGFLRRLFALCIAGLCVYGLVHGVQKVVKHANWKQDDTQSENAMEDSVQIHESDYPDSLLQLAKRNQETVQFVYDYPWEGGKTHTIDLSNEVTKGEIPLFLQWDERWGYETYGSDMIAITGCGPTCLSMVACGLTGDTKWSPLAVAQYAEKNGYYADGAGTTWAMMSQGASQLGLRAKELTLSDGAIRGQLEAGNPIICSMGEGDFTSSGHFVVLGRLNSDGTVQVCDPNSRKNSKKNWDLKRLMNQMQNLWVYTVAE